MVVKSCRKCGSDLVTYTRELEKLGRRNVANTLSLKCDKCGHNLKLKLRNILSCIVWDRINLENDETFIKVIQEKMENKLMPQWETGEEGEENSLK